MYFYHYIEIYKQRLEKRDNKLKQRHRLTDQTSSLPIKIIISNEQNER